MCATFHKNLDVKFDVTICWGEQLIIMIYAILQLTFCFREECRLERVSLRKKYCSRTEKKTFYKHSMPSKVRSNSSRLYPTYQKLTFNVFTKTHFMRMLETATNKNCIPEMAKNAFYAKRNADLSSKLNGFLSPSLKLQKISIDFLCRIISFDTLY